MPTNPGMHSVYDHVIAINDVECSFRRVPQCETYGTVPARDGTRARQDWGEALTANEGTHPRWRGNWSARRGANAGKTSTSHIVV